MSDLKPNEIRSEMLLRGVTVKTIAEKLGVSAAFVSMVIHGKKRTAGAQEAIAAAIGRTREEVFPEPKELAS